MTLVHLLLRLTGYSANSIFEQADTWVERGYNYTYVRTASGRLDRVISVMLNSVLLDDLYFANFYLKLNIDNERWRTAGEVKQLSVH